MSWQCGMLGMVRLCRSGPKAADRGASTVLLSGEAAHEKAAPAYLMVPVHPTSSHTT